MRLGCDDDDNNNDDDDNGDDDNDNDDNDNDDDDVSWLVVFHARIEKQNSKFFFSGFTFLEKKVFFSPEIIFFWVRELVKILTEVVNVLIRLR